MSTAMYMLAALLNPDSMWVTLLPVIGILLIIFGLLLRLRLKRRKAGPQLTAREQLERLNQEKAMRGDLEHLMVEIEQLARRLGAQLDAKTIALEKLIAEADRKIADLRRETSGESWPAPPASPVGDAGERTQEQELAAAVYRLADGGAKPVEIARQLNEGVGKVELILALRQA